MAGKQTPEFSPDDDRNRHRGADLHVPQVFEVNGRDRAGHGQREVERLTLGAELRIDRRDLVVHVGDQPQMVALVKFAGLPRNVRGREMQAQVGLAIRLGLCLGDDGAVPLGAELVDHDAVEARQFPQLPRRGL